MIISFCIAGYIILFYKNNQNVISDKLISFVSEMMAWIPMIICVGICIIYAFVMFSEIAKKLRIKIYLSIIFQFANVILIMLPQEMAEKINFKINTLILLLSFVGSFILHEQIGRELVNRKFSIQQEFLIMDRVSEEIEKAIHYKWSNYFNKVSWLFIVPFIFQPSPSVFSYMTIIIAILLIAIYVKYMSCYRSSSDAGVCRINFVIVIINIILSVLLGIIFYYFFEYKFLSFLAIYSSLFSKLMEDKKYALFIREKIDCNDYIC